MATGFCTSWVHAAPEPAIVPRSHELAFTHGKPQPIAIRNTQGDIAWYWYMTYKVTNTTGKDRLFLPEVTVAYDDGKAILTGRDVPATVFKQIVRREHNPLLKSSLAVVGKLLQGEDFARESVAIWPHFGKNVKEMRIFIAGLSGETVKMTLPKSKKQVLLRKTLMLVYGMPGTDVHPQDQPVLKRTERWIMR